jgi:lipid-binding SYLF domain-containing protein
MKLRFGLVAGLLLALSGTAISQEVDDFSRTIEEFRNVDAVAPYLDSAYGYAVWRTIARGGLGIGAATGKGQVYLNGEVTGFSRLIDVTFGFQAGGQAYRQIIFFQDERAYEEFTSGTFQFDAAASAVAVTAGAQANISTQGNQASAGAGSSSNTSLGGGYIRGLQIFTMTIGGLMYQATIGGQSYGFTPIE